ncbi:type II toxin-antitoxin system HicB family antitoxin [Roseitalea porphyridii]|uniref:Type II toxin-antitoxin system HicB family antitoxin n=1 Tax=Roseitalea porphyridii TaxID=1852022 RepID=A0A4P6UZ18_9HYPH|nr:type II toxin-antitoxin system HicB family antitoxin [Roseitalea porphyridii]QBK29210.1 type II toxin-antitoxin system HicB family antitoxin [Roseitalea porphyridii]
MIDRSKLIRTDGVVFDPVDYAVLVEPLGEDDGGGWMARIPALPGCVGDGETEQQAIDDVRLAALEWADATIEGGHTLPPPGPISLQAAE